MSTPFLVKDIFPGLGKSSPGNLTALYSFTNKC
jgi:ELWxxDGT repeat protein